MGKAIVINDLAFTQNLGKVTINGEQPSVVEITGLSIVSKPSVIQDSIQLSISYVPSNTTQKGVTWRSSDETIATVSVSGYVTVKKNGTVTITAASTYNSQLLDSFTANCSITQTHIPVTSLSLSGNNSGNVGDTIQLTASVLPVNATNKNVTWNSNNETLATVDDSGLVTLKAEGNVVITATSVSESNVSSSHSITVENTQGTITPLIKLSATGKSNSDADALVWADTSGNGNDFALSGFDMTIDDGWTGNSLKWKDGSKGMAKSLNTFIQGGYSTNKAVTILLKFKVNKNARNVIFDASGKVDGGDFKNNFMIQASYGKFQITSNESGNDNTPTFSSSDLGNIVHKGAIRQTENGCKTWLNDVSKDSSYQITNLQSTAYHLVLGQIGGMIGFGFCGELYDFQIYNRELTDSEIETLLQEL